MDLHTAPKFQHAIERAAEDVGAVVVDMGDVAFMDSTALSSLMRSKDALEQKGVSLRLAASNASSP
jgi:anti-anti-sigma factor